MPEELEPATDLAAQLLAAALQDGAGAALLVELKEVADPVLREALDVAEVDHLLLLGGEDGGHGVADELLALLALQGQEHGGFFALAVDEVVLEQRLDALAQGHEADTAGDRVEPGAKLRAAVELMELAEGLEHRLLGQILRAGLVPGEAQAQAVDPGPMALEEAVEVSGGLDAGTARLNQCALKAPQYVLLYRRRHDGAPPLQDRGASVPGMPTSHYRYGTDMDRARALRLPFDGDPSDSRRTGMIQLALRSLFTLLLAGGLWACAGDGPGSPDVGAGDVATDAPEASRAARTGLAVTAGAGFRESERYSVFVSVGSTSPVGLVESSRHRAVLGPPFPER
jgi:hypothetical protein